MSSAISEMDLDAQEALFFGHMGPLRKSPPPTSGHREPPPPGGPSDRGQKRIPKARPDRAPHPAASMWAYSSGSRRGLGALWGREDTMSEHKESEAHPEWLESKVYKLTQLVLRQEQTLASSSPPGHGDASVYEERGVRDDTSLLRCSDQVANHQGGGADQTALLPKLALFKQLLITLHERLGETSQKEEAMTHAKSLGGRGAELADIARESRPTSPGSRLHGEGSLLSQLVQMRRGSTEETILRFRSLRHLSPAVKAEWIQFQLVVSLRPEAAPVWSTLQGWIGSAAWHVLGCRLRRDRPAYDSLVNEIWSYQ